MEGVRLTGEFGSLLRVIFSPRTRTKFVWKGWSTENGERVQVFAYQVLQQNSPYSLTDLAQEMSRCVAGFHGLLYLDDGTQRTDRHRGLREKRRCGIRAAPRERIRDACNA